MSPWLAGKGFARRRTEGHALLNATHLEIERMAVRTLDALVRRAAGVTVRRLATGGGEIRLEPNPLSGDEPCVLAVYLNGAQVEFGRFDWTGVRRDQTAARAIRPDDVLPLDDIDGIEIYGPLDSPVAAEGTCGAVLLWSETLRPQLDEAFTGLVHGRAVDDVSGDGLAGVRIRLEPGDLEVRTDAEGGFAFPALLPGEYALSAEFPGAEPYRARILVKAFAVTEFELRLGRGRS